MWRLERGSATALVELTFVMIVCVLIKCLYILMEVLFSAEKVSWLHLACPSLEYVGNMETHKRVIGGSGVR